MELIMDMEYLKGILEKHYGKFVKELSFNQDKLKVIFKTDYTEGM